MHQKMFMFRAPAKHGSISPKGLVLIRIRIKGSFSEYCTGARGVNTISQTNLFLVNLNIPNVLFFGGEIYNLFLARINKHRFLKVHIGNHDPFLNENM